MTLLRSWPIALSLATWIWMAPGYPVAAAGAGDEIVRFREPHATAYRLEPVPAANAQAAAPGADGWRRATAAEQPGITVELGSRLVLQLNAGDAVEPFLEGRPVTLARTVAPGLHILQAPDSSTAITVAAEFADLPGVVSSYPVMRRPWKRQGPLAPLPNDPRFGQQWHLDHRGEDRNLIGPDLNARGAWAITRGEGVIVGVGDDGIQTSHPDLSTRMASGLNYNFFRGLATGAPASASANHGTAVAGLIGAEANNGRGVSGVAPKAQLASWVLFGTSVSGFDSFASDEQQMDMFQYASNRVAVQNHSWGNATLGQLSMDTLANAGVGHAVTNGRGGLGVVIVRAAGNYRLEEANANDDGFSADPRSVSVAAIRKDGRVTSYSSPGACILVGAPSGDTFPPDGDGAPTDDVQTTDRTGSAGYNTGTSEAASYTGFDGTSASSPQVAGVAALIVSANTNLTFRDVQHILVLSSRHRHLEDPAMKTNGAGFRVSENVGYGMPDAGEAVRIARSWTNLPPPVRVMAESRTRLSILDDALRVSIAGTDVPSSLLSIQCLPSLGVHPDVPTGARPLVDVGLAGGPISQDLTGKAALIRRGEFLFAQKIENA
ncbi:MAG: S8 family serine peptidase, partial [Verrucomicrobiae bacterium]|nr:S8 family serine peptidase [Verrucomicrobiae bacterium]